MSVFKILGAILSLLGVIGIIAFAIGFVNMFGVIGGVIGFVFIVGIIGYGIIGSLVYEKQLKEKLNSRPYSSEMQPEDVFKRHKEWITDPTQDPPHTEH